MPTLSVEAFQARVMLVAVPSRRTSEDGVVGVCVSALPALVGQTAVGHLVGQGVLEGEFTLGEQPRLVQELGGLQVVEAAV